MYVKKGINKLLRIFGFELRNITNKDNDWKIIEKLPRISTLIDIGIGDKGTPYLYKHFPEANMIFIDPLIECKNAVIDYLSVAKNKFIVTAVGAVSGYKTINVARKISQSSLLERTPLTWKGEPIEKRSIRIMKLDDVMRGSEYPIPYGIKIDTEGYEYDVIKGATKCLKYTEFIIIECRYRSSFYGQYSFYDLMNEIHQNGFVPAMIISADNRKCDMVFIRKNISLL